MKSASKLFLKLWLLACMFMSTATISAYGEVKINGEFSYSMSQTYTSEYLTWRVSQWTQNTSSDSGKVMLSPGSSAKGICFSWYMTKRINGAVPAVRIGTKADFSDAKMFRGSMKAIARKNWKNSYQACARVSVSKLKSNTTYYYSVTDNCNEKVTVWSVPIVYKTPSTNSFEAILFGDTQIGASGEQEEGTASDANIPADTYAWKRILDRATTMVPNARLILSVGDQINYKLEDNTDQNGVRESEYAGYLYPSMLRSMPIAAAIGNHESKGSDFQYHFNLPNATGGYGRTTAGQDYYFSSGDVLFIVLNSNSRSVTQHNKLMKKAVKKYPKAKWRIVMMHHDIYGSGELHSNASSANLRILFAPLMDKYKIDLCLSGHDHSYTRSYFMFDGTAIKYGKKKATNPAGTLYMSLGSSTGSKFYPLAAKKQYFVAERSNNPIPTFSKLKIKGNTLQIKTYDVNGKAYADFYTIKKTKAKTSYSKLKKLKLLKPTKADKGVSILENRWNKKTDPLTYYGHANPGWRDTVFVRRLKNGISTLLDKTTQKKVKVSGAKVKKALKKK